MVKREKVQKMDPKFKGFNDAEIVVSPQCHTHFLKKCGFTSTVPGPAGSLCTHVAIAISSKFSSHRLYPPNFDMTDLAVPDFKLQSLFPAVFLMQRVPSI